MSDKIARLGIERDNDLMYYIKGGDVWAVPRKQKGQPKGRPEKVAPTGLELDYSKFIYYLDGDGDVARKARALGGGRRQAARPTRARPTRASAPTTSPAPTTSSRRAGKKSEAQIAREVDECLAKVKSGDGREIGGTRSQPASKKKRR